MERFKLSKAQQAMLREQVIDAERPGPVLRDFRTLLDFLAEQGGVKAKGKYNLLPIESLGELNRRLSRPLVLELKRPQLRSHPYLQGLHLLLRATGLGRVEGTGTRARLVLDPALRAQWDRLNPTEQYFNLLEAWLCIGRPEMVGEASRSWGTPLMDCLQTFAHLPAGGDEFDLERPQDIYVFGIGRDLYQLALMDLFGLMEVKRPSRPVQPWRPAGVAHLPFGDAVLTLLAEHFFNPGALLALHTDEDQRADFGAWQPLFRPYFPEWRENLHVAAPEPRAGVFLFRVALGKARRLIAMPAEEVKILQPRVVVFFTGPWYNKVLERLFPEPTYPPCAGDLSRWVSRVQHAELPPNTFRTYHPGFLLRRKRPIIEQLSELIRHSRADHPN